MTMKYNLFLVVLIVMFFSCSGYNAEAPYTAQGAKVGEVTPNSAIIWVRLTEFPVRNADSAGWPDTGKPTKLGFEPNPGLVGECPGMAGKVRIHYGTDKSLIGKNTTEWITVNAENDFIHQFYLNNLKPGTEYYYQTETSDIHGRRTTMRTGGGFRTAPEPDRWKDILFTVITCHQASTRDREDGFNTYVTMKSLKPDFFVHTGDNVYYDRDEPFGTTPELARFHWHRMYSFPTIVSFLESVPCYFEKDDHDYRWDDADPYRDFPGISHEDGVAIFRQQVPMSGKTYRTFRWGSGLQIWLVEGRDYRSSNTMPDGPGKSIWGKEQKEWFKRTVRESDAAFRVLISPTPVVGPDRETKNDNYSNKGFAYEGNEIRRFIAQQKNMVVICGDRHWQYVSVDDETGVHEYACGPASVKHAGGWPPDKIMPEHRYMNVTGGFLSCSVIKENRTPVLIFRHYTPEGEVLNEDRFAGGK